MKESADFRFPIADFGIAAFFSKKIGNRQLAIGNSNGELK
jgi:hypothetical protein